MSLWYLLTGIVAVPGFALGAALADDDEDSWAFPVSLLCWLIGLSYGFLCIIEFVTHAH